MMKLLVLLSFLSIAVILFLIKSFRNDEKGKNIKQSNRLIRNYSKSNESLPQTSNSNFTHKYIIRTNNDMTDVINFLEKYDQNKRKIPLYLLFMSDESNNGNYWCNDCVKAHDIIYDTYTKVENISSLLEIQVGSPKLWLNEIENIWNDDPFFVEKIPTLMQWNGKNNTSNVLIEKGCHSKELVDYFFNEIQLQKKNIKYIDNYDDLIMLLNEFEVMQHPLFLYFHSGELDDTGRPWCSHCDKADILVRYFYHKYASINAVLYRIMVAATYEDWQRGDNPFHEYAKNGIPTLSKVIKSSTTSSPLLINYENSYDDHNALKNFFVP